MRSVAVGADYDIGMGPDRNLTMVTGKDCVQQDCVQATRMLLGEYPYDTNRGVPYMETLFRNKSVFEFEEGLRAELLRVPNVRSVKDFRVIQVSDILEFEAVIDTTFGPLEL